MYNNYKEIVDKTKEEVKEEEKKKWEDAVNTATKKILKDIKRCERQIKHANERLAKYKQRLEDLENGNAEYDEDGSVTGIIIENRTTGDKVCINAKGEISDKQNISTKSAVGVMVDLAVNDEKESE